MHSGANPAIEVDIALYQGGFGSGKTWIGSLIGIMLAQEYPGKLGLVVSKTFPLLRDTTLRTYLEHLEAIGFREGKHYTYVRADAKLIFSVYGGSEILFRSLQTPEKLKSINASWIHIEEASQLTESDFLMLLSRLRGNVPRLRLFAHTNPQANKDWIWQYFVARKTQTPRIQYRRIIAPSTENTHLPPGYLENMATQYGAAYYKMNVLGQDGEATEGLVCKGWSEANADRSLAYDPEQVLYLSCDFNVDPMCWVVAHRVLLPGNMSQYEFIDELCVENTNIIEVAIEFARRYGHHQAGVMITGDATGRNRSDSSSNPNFSKYRILMNTLSECGMHKVHLDVLSSNPHQDLRVETWNGMLCNQDSLRRIKINPERCPWLVWNMENLKYVTGTQIIEEPSYSKIQADVSKTLKFTKHPFDAASYLVYRYDPINRQSAAKVSHKLVSRPFEPW